MKTIGIIGCRCRDSNADLKACKEIFLLHYEKGDRLVSGHCPKGGDRFCEVFAKELGLTEENGKLILHRPDWDKHGYNAGFARNTYIAEDADVIIAVVKNNDDPLYGGTGDTLLKAIKRFGKDLEKDIILVPQISIEDFDQISIEDFDPLEEI